MLIFCFYLQINNRVSLGEPVTVEFIDNPASHAFPINRCFCFPLPPLMIMQAEASPKTGVPSISPNLPALCFNQASSLSLCLLYNVVEGHWYQNFAITFKLALAKRTFQMKKYILFFWVICKASKHYEFLAPIGFLYVLHMRYKWNVCKQH